MPSIQRILFSSFLGRFPWWRQNSKESESIHLFSVQIMSDSQNLTFDGKPTTFNYTTYDNPGLCTLSTCPESYATLRYVPSLAANAFFLAWFATLFVIQTAIGVRKRTWSFFVAMIGGCILEVVGYVGRIMMHNNIFVFNNFLM